MKIMKSKVVALVVAFMMIFSLTVAPVVSAEETATTTTTVEAAATVTTSEDAAKFLSEKNLLQGDDNGDLMLGNQLTREQMMVIISRLLGVEDEAKNYSTEEMTFKDVPTTDAYAPYVAWAEANGITQGHSEEVFGFKEALTAWQTKAFFVRALGYVETSDEDMDAKADELGITAGSDVESDAAILRGEMAVLMFNTVNAKNSDGEVLGKVIGVLEDETPAALEMTVAATAIKTIKVTFNRAVEDTTKVVFGVTKDSVKVNVSSTAWNEAKTEATLTMASNLTEGDYAVKVTGVEMATSEKTVTVKDEETGKIEFLSDKAVLISGATNVYTYIKVTNQYGQDITEDATLSFTASSSTNPGVDSQDKNGKIVIHGAYEKDDKITVTAIDSESGAFANATLTVVDAAGADAVTVAKLYCDDEDAVVRAESTDNFYLLFTAKDQYGNAMPVDATVDAEAIADSLLITSSNTSRVAIGSAAAHYNVEKKTVDDVDYVALPLTIGDQAGAASIRIISKTTGKSAVYDMNVLEKAEVDSVTLTAPAIAAVGEDIEFEATATDKEGKAVTSASDMSDVEVTPSGIHGITSAQCTWKKEGSKLILSIDATASDAINDVEVDANKKNDSKSMILTVVTPTNKVTQKTVKVYEKAVPTTVGKLVDTATALLETYTTDIIASDDEDDNNVVVYDQYDRVYDYADNNFFGTYELKFSVEDTTNVNVEGGASAFITTDGGHVTLTGVEKGSETVTVGIAKKSDNIVITDSELDFTSNVVELADIKSYEVKDLPTIYAFDAAALDAYLQAPPFSLSAEASGAIVDDYTAEVTVYGVLSNGSKVEMPKALYSVVASLPNCTATVTGLTVANVNELSADITKIPFESNKETTTGMVTVTVGGAEGPVTVQKAVNVSKAVNVATDITLSDENADPAITLDGDTVTISSGDLTNASILRSVVKVEDQYGVENPVVAPTSTIFSNITDDNEVNGSLLTCNNTTGVITNDADGDTFKVTFIYANGKSISLNVTVAQDTVAPVISSVTENGTSTVLTVAFSEAVNEAAVENNANWTFTPAVGTVAITGVVYNEANHTAAVTLDGAALVGDKLLAKAAIVDLAGNPVNTANDTATRGAGAAGAGAYTID